MFIKLFGCIRLHCDREKGKPFFRDYIYNNLRNNVIKAFNCSNIELPFNIDTEHTCFNKDVFIIHTLYNKSDTPYIQITQDIDTVSIMNFFYLMQKESSYNFVMIDFLFKMTVYDDNQKPEYTCFYSLDEITKEIKLLKKISYSSVKTTKE